MGFPLRSNIFRANTNEQAYFARFPVQVAVLFSPSDREFGDAFKEIFAHLDALTGKDVAFFAVLDPPEDWIRAAENREWWREYRMRIGESGYSVNNKPLVRELARLFGVRWGDLPALVVGTDLWTAEFLTVSTSASLIEDQLRVLTELVNEWGRPNIGQVAEALAVRLGQAVEHHPRDETLRFRLQTTYAILDAGELHNLFGQRKEDFFERLLDREMATVEGNLNRVRRRASDELIGETAAFDDGADQLIEDAAGRLVAPATVAQRIFHELDIGRMTRVTESLEEESLVMLETSLKIGHWLEQLEHRHLGFRFHRRRPRPPDQGEDFTAGAQGAWKAFELEVNLSLIQAARNARSIQMPNFFSLYDPHPPKNKGKIKTGTDRDGREIWSDINQLDWRDKQRARHRFLPLGEAWHVTQKMHHDPVESFNQIVLRCLDQPLPPRLLDAWRQINIIRNNGSHVRPLSRHDYEELWRLVTDPKLLSTLTTIKQRISGRQ